MVTHTHRELWLTVYAHEWYWCNISQRLDDGKQSSPRHFYMPMLHRFYDRYRDDMPNFPTFDSWLDAVWYLGRPIDCWRTRSDGSYLAPEFIPQQDRIRTVARFLLARDVGKKKKKSRKWFFPDGGKWRKEWEPDAVTWQRKKEAREKKKEWRDQLRKDQGWRRPRYQRGPGRWYKKSRSSQHRAWTKEQIHRENWDAFHPKERYVFQDPWMWGW